MRCGLLGGNLEVDWMGGDSRGKQSGADQVRMSERKLFVGKVIGVGSRNGNHLSQLIQGSNLHTSLLAALFLGSLHALLTQIDEFGTPRFGWMDCLSGL